MNGDQAVSALSALAQGHRLKIFRLLVKEGPGGLPAGEIAERVGIAPSALSFHLTQLERCGLLGSGRVKRNIYYAIEVDGISQLLTFLTEDCCGGRPEICGSAAGLFATYDQGGESIDGKQEL